MLKKYGECYFFSLDDQKNILEIVNDLKELLNKNTGKDNLCFYVMLAGVEVSNAQAMLSKLKEHRIPVFGAFFPQLIVNGNLVKKGLLIKAVHPIVPPILIKKLSQKNFSLHQDYMKKLKKAPVFSSMVIIDGFAPGADFLVNSLFEAFGDSCAVFGGGGGHFDLENRPCIFDNSGIYSNAALIFFFPFKACTGVSHGYKKRISPLVATATSDENVLVGINWEPAWDVYKKYIEELSGQKLDLPLDQIHTNPLCKTHPFGIHRDDSENVLRDILKVQADKSILLGGHILEDSVLNIMEGNCSDLLKAAEKAAERSIPEDIETTDSIKDTLLFDCVTRNEAMEEDFAKELGQIKEKFEQSGIDIPMNGALTIGEIASTGRSGSADIYNKTLVIANLYTPETEDNELTNE